MKSGRLLSALLIVSAALHGCNSQDAGEGARLLVFNAQIWTADLENPTASALLLENGRFTCVGDEQIVRTQAGPGVKTLDAGGARIIPGLIDAHMHVLGGGLQLSRINLRDEPDRAAFVAAVQARARQLPRGAWILGGRYSTDSWPSAAQPSKRWLDPVTPDHPVLLSRMDGHEALANSRALDLARIDRRGPANPPGGVIERDPRTREPTGILKDAAIGLVRTQVPAPSAETLDEVLAAAMQEANRHGLTCVHTMSGWSAVGVFDRARAGGQLTLRIREYVSESDWSRYLERVRDHQGDDWVRVNGFKQFMDGSLGARTAFMAAPYEDNPPEKADWRGLLGEVMASTQRLEELCDLVDKAGYAPAIHAIGDQANHLVLDIYENTARRNGASVGRRMRIEHAQHLLPVDIERFARLGVVASMQPLHKADDGRYAEKAIGRERCASSYAFRSLLDAGARLAFGSDWPVVSLDPFLGIHAAVTGQALDGKTFVPEQNISAEEALRAYTVGAADAGGDGNRLGQIKAGYLADFVILEDDPLQSPPAALSRVSVAQTYVNGRLVWPR